MGAGRSRPEMTSIPATATSNERVAIENAAFQDALPKCNIFFIHSGVTCADIAAALGHIAPYSDPELTQVGQSKSSALGKYLQKALDEDKYTNPLVFSSPFIAAQQTAELMLNPSRIFIAPYIGSRKEYFSPEKQAEILTSYSLQPDIVKKRNYTFFEQKGHHSDVGKFLKWFSKNYTTFRTLTERNESRSIAEKEFLKFKETLPSIRRFPGNIQRTRQAILEQYDIVFAELKWLIFAIIKHLYSEIPETEELQRIENENTQYLYVCLYLLYMYILSLVQELRTIITASNTDRRATTVRHRVESSKAAPVASAAPAARIASAAPTALPEPANLARGFGRREATPAVRAGAGAGAGATPLTPPRGRGAGAGSFPQTGGDGRAFGDVLRDIQKAVARPPSPYESVGMDSLKDKALIFEDFEELNRRVKAYSKFRSQYAFPPFFENLSSMIKYREAYNNIGFNVNKPYIAANSNINNAPIRNERRNNHQTSYTAKMQHEFDPESIRPSFIFVTHRGFLEDLVRSPLITHTAARDVRFKQNSVQKVTVILNTKENNIVHALYDGPYEYERTIPLAEHAVKDRHLFTLGMSKAEECAKDGDDICRKPTCGTRRARSYTGAVTAGRNARLGTRRRR
jgi:hypothetical protein